MDIVALHYNPRIVTSGLVLCLDAANTKSYPGSGTTWTDITGSGNNGTLTNGPTFSSENGGSIVFDGSDDYATIADVTGVTDFSRTDNYSVSFWVNLTSSPPGTEASLVEKWTSSGGYPYVFRYIKASGTIFSAVYNGSTVVSLSLPFTVGTWTNICGVFNHSGTTFTLYKNGNSETTSTTLNITGTITNTSELNLMRRGNNTFLANGRLSLLTIYNRALAEAEVIQNFNAHRGRFGI
jgi:hypothetical protein